MRYATAVAFRTALEARLLARARETGQPISRLRKTVVFDRLLARLLVVAPDRWLLKGALALDFRLGLGTRTTKDMDLGREDGEAAATEDFLAAQEREIGDFFRFQIARTSALDQLTEGSAVRYHAGAYLAGRPFEHVTVDVGFGTRHSPAETVIGPDLLAFADLAPLSLPALPLADHVAEKVHAYTRDYGPDRPNTRVKDLVDLVLIQANSAFSAGPLRDALEAVFATRGLQVLPSSLPPPPAAWAAMYGKLAREVGLTPDVLTGHALVAAFLDPVLRGLAATARWDPAGGGWSTAPSSRPADA